MANYKSELLPLYGKRNGNLITPYTTKIWINERRVTPGHIVELQDRLLECTGFQDDLLLQPRFRDVTREIREYEAQIMAVDYQNTIGDFLMGTGRM